MPNPVPPLDEFGRLRPYTADEIQLMKIRWRGIRDGSTPTLSFGVSDNRATVTCLIDPAEFNSAILYFVGTSKVVDASPPTIPTPRISRLLPFRLPGREGLVCTKIGKATGHKFTGKTPGLNWVQYQDVELELILETPKYELFEDDAGSDDSARFVEPLPASWSSETIATLGGTLKYCRDPSLPNPTAPPHGQVVNANTVFKTQPTEKFSYVWWRVPYAAINDESDLWARLQGTGSQDNVPLIGSINSTILFGRQKGTVELKGVVRTLDVSPIGDGTFEWRVEYQFETLPSMKNSIYFASIADTGLNGYYFVTSLQSGGEPVFAAPDAVGDKDSIYAARDLRLELFRP